MKKITVLLVALVVCVLTTQAQTEYIKLDKTVIGGISITHTLVKEASDTTAEFISFSFQNIKYTTIVDLGSRYLFNLKELESFKEEFKLAMAAAIEKREVVYTTNGLSTYDFTKNIYLTDRKSSRKYTSITPRNAIKISAYLDTVKFTYHK